MAYSRLVPRLLFRFLLYVLLAYCIIAGVYLLLDWQGYVRPDERSTRESPPDAMENKENPFVPVADDNGPAGKHPKDIKKPPHYEVFRDDFDQDGKPAPMKSKLDDEPSIHSKRIRDLSAKVQTQDSVIQDLNQKLQSMNNEKEELIDKMEDLRKKEKDLLEPKQTPFSRTMQSDNLPPSSNLCYNPKADSWFVVKSNRTVYLNVPEDRSDGFMDMTSLLNHGVFFWNYAEVPEGYMKNQSVEVVKERTYIMMRFHTGNIMHAMHDDFIGLYHHLKMYSPTGDSDKYSDSGYVPFTLDHNLLFVDGGDQGGYGHVFQVLTDRPLQFKSTLSKERITCFADAVVGQSKQANWYQYGFGEVQGPLKKKVNGHNIREAAAYMMKRLGIPAWDRSLCKDTLKYLRVAVENNAQLQHLKLIRDLQSLPASYRPLAPPKDANISIFSRRHDRLLKNEEELATLLEETFNIPVKFVRNEDLNFKEQVEVLRNSVISIGMHGSLLIMGMFQPPGSIMIELYPYAVPGNNYSPYKTMCHHPGIELFYRNWMNTHPENNFPHPEYPQFHGGLMDFTEEKRTQILDTLTVPAHHCCSDPYWLFRIYQDTVVHLGEALELITEAIVEAEATYQEVPPKMSGIVPAALSDNVKVLIMNPSHGDVLQSKASPKVVVEWEKPWNVESVPKYGVWVHQQFKEHFTQETHMEFPNLCEEYPGQEIDMWVRWYFANGTDTLNHGAWSKKVTCKC